MNFSTSDMTVSFQAVMQTNQQPSQLRSNQQIDPINTTWGGLFVIFLFISYICIGFGYKKHREDRKVARFQKIKTLEKIWKMPAYQQKN